MFKTNYAYLYKFDFVGRNELEDTVTQDYQFSLIEI